jgi:hypothetical protein
MNGDYGKHYVFKIHNGNSTFRLYFSHPQQWIQITVDIIPEPTARVLIPPGYLHPGETKALAKSKVHQ